MFSIVSDAAKLGRPPGAKVMAGVTSDVRDYAITQRSLGNGNYTVTYVGANATIASR
jgi:hypothetical protein